MNLNGIKRNVKKLTLNIDRYSPDSYSKNASILPGFNVF